MKKEVLSPRISPKFIGFYVLVPLMALLVGSVMGCLLYLVDAASEATVSYVKKSQPVPELVLNHDTETYSVQTWNPAIVRDETLSVTSYVETKSPGLLVENFMGHGHDGEVRRILNVGAWPFYMKSQYDDQITVMPYDMLYITYDGDAGRWILL